MRPRRRTIEPLEEAIGRERGNDGPYFNGPKLSFVDAAYAPFLQRFLTADSFLKTGLLDGFPLVKAWAEALLASETVTGAVAPNFLEEFYGNLRRREFYVATLIDGAASEAAE